MDSPYEEINAFERTLADDQTVFVKVWLHISKAEQLRRFLYLSQQPELAWHVAAEDWEHHRKYDEYLAAVRDMLENTHTSIAPWTVIPATDANYRTYAVFRALIARLEAALVVEPMAWPVLDELEKQSSAQRKKEKEKQKEKTRAKQDEGAKKEKKRKKDKQAKSLKLENPKEKQVKKAKLPNNKGHENGTPQEPITPAAPALQIAPVPERVVDHA
ncbi:MAG: hypothetical protein R3E79_44275 [Caldilineaceae bacterium]